MDFIYADSLKLLFKVFGHFYDLKLGEEIFKCRSVLEIVADGVEYSANTLPDAVVIMMNPGSSRPLYKSYQPKCHQANDIYSDRWQKEIIETRPDNAQYQIMRLMLMRKWKIVRVLNLSDLRNGNSIKFASEFQTSSEIDETHPHSILNVKRSKEFKSQISTKKNGPIIAAWGSVEVLRELAVNAKKILNGTNLVGVNSDNNSPWYKYPSPYRKEDKLKWLKSMTIALGK